MCVLVTGDVRQLLEVFDVIFRCFSLRIRKCVRNIKFNNIFIYFGTLLEEGIISMGLSQKVKGVFNHKGWFQWTFNFMLRKII